MSVLHPAFAGFETYSEADFWFVGLISLPATASMNDSPSMTAALVDQSQSDAQIADSAS